MAVDTEISIPAADPDVTTSPSEVSTEETTSQGEITQDNGAAETGTEPAKTIETEPDPVPVKLFAGKYNSVEELEKGYAEAQKTLTQSLQYKSKYEDLRKEQEAKEAKLLERARQLGYNTVNDQQIAQQVAQAEYEEFANGVNYYVDAESQAQVNQYLNIYRQTGDLRYLAEAKRYFPSEFLENVAVGKLNMQNQLRSQFENETREKAERADVELAEILRADYGDFIETVKANKGASKALEMFCNAGFIKSKEDMEAFKKVYDDIVNAVSEKAIQEYEAKKAIDKTKQAAHIGAGAAVDNGILDEKPTVEQLEKMSADEYDKAVKKYGLEKLFS